MIQADITRWYNSTNRLAQTSPLSVFYLQTISHLSSKNGSRHNVKYLQETRTNVTLAIRWLAVHEIRKNQLIILEFLSHWKLQWKNLSSQVSAILLHKEWGRKTKRNLKKSTHSTWWLLPVYPWGFNNTWITSFRFYRFDKSMTKIKPNLGCKIPQPIYKPVTKTSLPNAEVVEIIKKKRIFYWPKW